METITSLQEAPTLAAVCQEAGKEEAELTERTVLASSLELDPDGFVASKGSEEERWIPSEDGVQDLANLAGIPGSYFCACDPWLRSVSFNRRSRLIVAPGRTVHLILRNRILEHIQNGSLLRTPRRLILDTIGNAIPHGINRDDLRVNKHAWNGTFDVSVIAPNLTSSPRVGDVVAYGVNVSEGLDGAIQVQGAAFRYACSNGAIHRVCDGRHHRIRRPISRDHRQEQFLDRVRNSATEAWKQWSSYAEGLAYLTTVPLAREDTALLASRLRQAPFFLAQRVVELLLARLETDLTNTHGLLCLYDIYNALTYLGTHDTAISRIYRFRLRIGAGELSRRSSSVCQTCRQLLLRR